MREKILLKMLTVTDRAIIKLKIEYGREKSLVQYNTRLLLSKGRSASCF